MGACSRDGAFRRTAWHGAEPGLGCGVPREQFGRLGNTPYELSAIELDVEGAPFAPSSLLNQLRREAVEALQEVQAASAHRDTRSRPRRFRACSRSPQAVPGGPVELHLLVRTPEQLEAALELRPASITLDYLDLYGLRPSLERVGRRHCSRAWPVRACSSRAKSASSISC